MGNLSSKELDLYSNKILEDYDAKNPSQLFKDKVEINNENALLIQSKVADLRLKRGEEIIGYKIGCVSKHIPGHGSSLVDTHLKTSIIKHKKK